LSYTSLVVAAWHGQEALAMRLIEDGRRDATGRGEGRAVALAEYATAVLCNGLGRYKTALAAARKACEHDDLNLFGWALIELVEAAARRGEPELAADACQQLCERTRLGGTDWALGIEARSRGLLSENQQAEELYLEAIERLGRSRIKVHLARAHLIYGEWLRRENRRADARMPLRLAHEMFASMGAEAFAQRTERELLATGEKARKRTDDTRGQLTAQETQIAQLAREGHSNPEIGAQLFISRRTVEYHLHKVFTKLAISSRSELTFALTGETREVH
jgi:DNA-binding NarL/FixJ family response regulator